MKNLALLLAAAALSIGGCGSSDSNTSSAQDAAFKSGSKPTVTMPPGANKPPANFKSSLDTGNSHVPANVSGTAGGG